MTARTKKRSLWLALETNYAEDPSANGAGYLPVASETLGDPTDTLQRIETNYHTSREWMTAAESGADGATIQFSVPLYGNLTAAGDGVNASTITDDVLDIVLEHLLGASRTTPGEGVNTSGPATVDLDTDVLNANDPILVYESAMDRAEAMFVESEAGGTLTTDTAWNLAPTTAAVAYGAKVYEPNAPYTGGPSMSAVFQDDTIGTYRLAGGRVTACSLSGEMGQRALLDVTMRFDHIVEEASAKTSLPAVLSVPPTTPVKMLWSPIRVHGAFLGSASVSLDFGVVAAEVKDVSQKNGRSGDEGITLRPVLTVVPLRTESLRVQSRALASGIVGVQLGSGILQGGKVNALQVVFGNGQFVSHSNTDDEGHARMTIQIEAKDAGTRPFVQVARW